ncbi:related to ascospore maturation 1 protein [Lichtheimia corymbifera JMRC:FSU:9682]|uniref:Related to ascospore maturation 1 protein n=1 Tax=Lichtheimia corymbifera JMRC:FSU:9682 TaxID=1263082 RepID=A0A068RKZ7_9FUNG|nr:related to ascospore maturation 1 protein [Lichtheimia corymbifera JMRC:FSU:9682]
MKHQANEPVQPPPPTAPSYYYYPTPTSPTQHQPPPTPPNTYPKLTTSVWEDQNTLCYQVDVNGVCVARRQDNDMVNGTKLLNVTGISRGKRDGILKHERGRVVVKVGAMHLKGVWITFARAKALAAQFNIDKMLHPLFEDDPTAYFCHQDYYGTASTAAAATQHQQQPSLQHPQEECPSWQLGSSSILSEYSAPGTPDIFPPHQQEMMPFSFVSMMNLQEPEDEQMQQQHDFYYYCHNH